jgi:hypothetical protein
MRLTSAWRLCSPVSGSVTAVLGRDVGDRSADHSAVLVDHDGQVVGVDEVAIALAGEFLGGQLFVQHYRSLPNCVQRHSSAPQNS